MKLLVLEPMATNRGLGKTFDVCLRSNPANDKGFEALTHLSAADPNPTFRTCQPDKRMLHHPKSASTHETNRSVLCKYRKFWLCGQSPNHVSTQRALAARISDNLNILLARCFSRPGGTSSAEVRGHIHDLLAQYTAYPPLGTVWRG